MLSPRFCRGRKFKLLLVSTGFATIFFTGFIANSRTVKEPNYSLTFKDKIYTVTYSGLGTDYNNSSIIPVQRFHIVTHNESRPENDNLKYKYHRRERKYLFALQFYEQLGRATENLIQLASLGKYGNRKVSLPFVNNSRLSGVPYKANSIDHISSKPISKSFSSLATYYDLKHFNNSLLERGYGIFIDYNEFIRACKNKINTMVHFIYPERNTFYSTLRWFNMSKASLEKLVIKIKENGGWIDCSFLNTNNLVRELSGITIQRLFCVDPDIIVSPEELELVIFKRKACVGVLFWKGCGEKERAKFPLHPSIASRLHISELRHSKSIINTAEEFVAKKFSHDEFLSVHIRAEKLLLDFGLNRTFACLEKAALLINEVRETYALSNIFLSTDFSVYGSDTFVALTKFPNYHYFETYLETKLTKIPVTFSPNETVDKGVISLIEMNILAKGSYLITVGRGRFHSWVVEYFLKGKQTAQIERVCHGQP